jgi:hypothetical protein
MTAFGPVIGMVAGAFSTPSARPVLIAAGSMAIAEIAPMSGLIPARIANAKSVAIHEQNITPSLLHRVLV